MRLVFLKQTLDSNPPDQTNCGFVYTFGENRFAQRRSLTLNSFQ